MQDEATSRVFTLKDALIFKGSDIRNVVREVETIKQISHKNVIAVIGADHFSDTPGLHMLILTEYYAGGNLNERLTRRSYEEMNLKWIRQTAAALHYLHSSGVVHRDLKPDNVLLTAAKNVKLADFLNSEFHLHLSRVYYEPI